MEELIFFAVIILFSILDAIARKKRGQEAEEPSDPGDAERWEERYGPEHTARVEDASVPGEALSRYTGPYGTRQVEPASSEAMVPEDIWDEIAALAGGERPPSRAEPEPTPEPEPWAQPDTESRRGGRKERGASLGRRGEPGAIPTTSPIRRSQVGRREVGSRGGVGEHPIHRSHADYGTDPSERAAPAPPVRQGPSREARAVRQALVEGGSAAARRAVILHEVLGKPLAYRQDGPGSD